MARYVEDVETTAAPAKPNKGNKGGKPEKTGKDKGKPSPADKGKKGGKDKGNGKPENTAKREALPAGKEKTVAGITYFRQETGRGQRVTVEGASLSSVLRYLGSKGKRPGEVRELMTTLKIDVPDNTLISQVNSGRLAVSGNHVTRDTPHHGTPPTDAVFPGGRKLLKLMKGGETGGGKKDKGKPEKTKKGK